MTLRQTGVLLVLALVWGASFLFIRLGVETIPPITFVFLRLAIAAVLIYAVLRWQKIQLPRERKLWYSLGFVGFVNAALPYCLFAWGEHKMGANASGLASIYNATTPLWTVILAFAFVRSERLTGVRTFGIVLGFAGVVYLFSRSIGNINSLDTWGQIACIIASSMYGIGTLYVRRNFGSLPALIPAFGQMASGAIMLLPVAIVVDHNSWQMPSLVSLGSLFGLAILGTGIAQILYFWLVKQVGAARTAQVTYILPIFAIFWGWLFLNEAIRSDMLIGLCLILLGVIIVNGKWPFRRQTVAAPSN